MKEKNLRLVTSLVKEIRKQIKELEMLVNELKMFEVQGKND